MRIGRRRKENMSPRGLLDMGLRGLTEKNDTPPSGLVGGDDFLSSAFQEVASYLRQTPQSLTNKANKANKEISMTVVIPSGKDYRNGYLLHIFTEEHGANFKDNPRTQEDLDALKKPGGSGLVELYGLLSGADAYVREVNINEGCMTMTVLMLFPKDLTY